ncbi:uncharacterized protein BN777_00982 [Bacteroides sp. CAG:770]|nr:uncharacterized protein BN777_00982 [Bacteroides sp. CAG:770]
MVACPSAMALTLPSCETVATPSADDVHTTELKSASSGVNVACNTVSSPGAIVTLVALSVIVSTFIIFFVTVTSHSAFTSPVATDIVASPGVKALILPSWETDATLSSEDAHTTVPTSASAGENVACNVNSSPTSRLTLVELSVILFTVTVSSGLSFSPQQHTDAATPQSAVMNLIAFIIYC